MMEEKMIQKNEQTPKEWTRRKLLANAGVLATGVIAAGALAGCGAGSEPPKTQANAAPATTLPWKYQKLDIEVVRKRGYEAYFKGGCCYGAAFALMTTLKETVGAPWDTIPPDMFKYGAGGALSWGTLCGALNGALAVMNLADAKYADLGNELMGWYTEFPFPSDKHESYAKFKNQITTVAKSPLCHASVSIWCNKANAKVNSDEKKDRCAKLTGDVAAYAADLMNKNLEGKFAAAFKPAAEYATCMTCHTGDKSTLDNEQGKMNCITCHDDHTKKK